MDVRIKKHKPYVFVHVETQRIVFLHVTYDSNYGYTPMYSDSRCGGYYWSKEECGDYLETHGFLKLSDAIKESLLPFDFEIPEELPTSGFMLIDEEYTVLEVISDSLHEWLQANYNQR